MPKPFFPRTNILRKTKQLQFAVCLLKSLYRSSVLLTAFLAFPVLAAAGTPETDKAEDAAQESLLQLDTVTVTANKMQEDITDVPQSISVISDSDIEMRGIWDVTDVVTQVPGMNYIPSTSSGTDINFRGLNASLFTNNNPVVIYVDGVPTSSRWGFDFSMANVERIEVLRGPQGTLYGKDAIGGVINVVTKDPSNEWHGKMGAEYESFARMQGTANINGPIVEDKIFMGLNTQYKQSEGWITNDYPGMDEDADRMDTLWGNGYLLFTPTDSLRIRFSMTYGRDKRHWPTGYALPVGTTMDAFDRDDAEHVRFDVPARQEVEENSQSLTASYDFGPVKLESISTHKHLTLDNLYDMDYGADPMYAGLSMFDDTTVNSWSQELRLSSTADDGIRWIGGVYLDKESREKGPAGQQFPSYGTAGTFYGNFEMDSESTLHSTTLAVFGQAMIPFWKRFELTLGGRLQRLSQHFDLSTSIYPMGGSAAPAYTMDTRKTWTAFLPKAALSYKISDSWTTYASYSKGYMPGGFNIYANAGSKDDNTFEPEISTNYELGLKGVYESFRLSLALFYMEIKDIHVYKYVGNMPRTDNAKRAHSEGAELEFTYLPLKDLEITGAASVIQAKYDDYDAGTTDYDGKDIENTPSHTLRLDVSYHHSSGLYAWGEVRNVGRIHYFDNYNSDFVMGDSYTLADLKIGYNFRDWTVYAFANNITDEKYVTAFVSTSAFSHVAFGAPRTFGVGIRYTF